MLIANSIEAKDETTKGHVERVTKYAVKLGKYFKMPAENIDTLKKASMLHDIGKIGVPDNILNKQGKLTGDELEIMRNHTLYGAHILQPLSYYQELINIVKHHHEKLDGSGHPDGLRLEQINLETRILTILDIYDALVSERPYKQPFTEDEAIKILEEEVAKGYLDGQVLGAFKEILKSELESSENASN